MPAPVLPRSLCDKVDVLRDRTLEVTELAGGLTNRNYKVATADGTYVVRISGGATGALAIDRDNEYRNSVIAAESGVGAPVHAYVPEESALVIGYLEGRTFTDDDFGRPGVVERVATSCRRLHDGRRFVNDFDMFDIQRGYLAIVRRARLPAARRLPRLRRRRRADPGGPGRPARAHGGLQQRPAGRQLHRRRRPDPRSSTTSTRATTTPASNSATSGASATSTTTSSSSWSPRTTGRRLRQQGRPGPAVGPHVPVRVDAVGLDPGGDERHRLRLLAVGAGEVRAGGGHLPRTRARPA